MKKLPIGMQNFKTLIKENYIYIDKTKTIYQLVSGKMGRYFFLSRPRRFGKSLLVSTLKELFLGNKELFKNLWIYNSDFKWKSHLVISLDFSTIGHRTAEELTNNISWKLEQVGQENEIYITSVPSIEAKFQYLITQLSKIKKVVILIDEYDKPLIDHINNPEEAFRQQEILRSFYSVIKASDVEFVFLTGVTKFSKTSVFSGLNNLIDLTILPEMGGLLGYTQLEVDKYFCSYANAIAENKNQTIEHIKAGMRAWYNGYQFSETALKVYNPFSVLSYLSTQRLSNYWFETGTPFVLINLIKINNYPIENIQNSKLNDLDLASMEINHIKLIPLLFQTGYLTIKSYDEESRNYTLDYPNEETKVAFLYSIMDYLMHISVSATSAILLDIIKSLKDNDLNQFFQNLNVFFSGIPYTIQEGTERYYQSCFYILMKLTSAYIRAEEVTNVGRIDAIIINEKTIYIFEFKVNQSADIALQQIEDKKYFEPYLLDNKKIIAVGVNFNTSQRNIDSWKEKVIL